MRKKTRGFQHALSCLILAPLCLIGTLAGADDRAPCFEITPKPSLYDEQVKVDLINLKPNQTVTVRAVAGVFNSALELTADEHGRVDLGGPSADRARAEKVAPLRIVWSMKADPTEFFPARRKLGADPLKVTLSAFSDGKEIASGSLELVNLSAEVERIAVNEQGLRGLYFRPKAGGRYPGLMVLSGSGGGVIETMAAMLASRGYAVLALAYFNYDDLPRHLIRIPLEYFETGLKWLQKQESVQADKLAVVGKSRGGELVLLLGATFPEVKAVVAYAPSHVVWSGLNPVDARAPAWIYKGRSLPSIGRAKFDSGELAPARKDQPEVGGTPWFRLSLKDEEAVRQASIPVEKIRGPVLLVTGEDDQAWPSAEMADQVMKRLIEHKHPYPDKHLCYANCGHLVETPNYPVGESRIRHPVTKRVLEFGGTPEGNAYGSWDSWPQVLRFLDESLR